MAYGKVEPKRMSGSKSDKADKGESPKRRIAAYQPGLFSRLCVAYASAEAGISTKDSERQVIMPWPDKRVGIVLRSTDTPSEMGQCMPTGTCVRHVRY